MGKILILLGVFLIVLGILVLCKVNFSWLGKLPGDLNIKMGNTNVYFPLVTCLIASGILSLLSFLVSLFSKR